MKTFEITIAKSTKEVGEKLETTFTWPEWWPEVVESVEVVAYEETDKKGNRNEGCVCVCKDEVWKYIAKKKDPLVKKLSENSANEKGRAWRPQVIQIQDPVKVLAACAKSALGRALTVEEKKILDPDNPTPGVGKSKKFDVRELCARSGEELNEE